MTRGARACAAQLLQPAPLSRRLRACAAAALGRAPWLAAGDGGGARAAGFAAASGAALGRPGAAPNFPAIVSPAAHLDPLCISAQAALPHTPLSHHAIFFLSLRLPETVPHPLPAPYPASLHTPVPPSPSPVPATGTFCVPSAGSAQGAAAARAPCFVPTPLHSTRGAPPLSRFPLLVHPPPPFVALLRAPPTAPHPGFFSPPPGPNPCLPSVASPSV